VPPTVSDALAGIRVVDLTSGTAGPVATMFLADFGADVMTLEPRGAPTVGTPESVVWSRGKRLVDGDLEELVVGADVLVVNEVWTGAVHPRLVVLQLTPYTDTAPWDGGESVGMLAAMTGVSMRQSSFDGGPIEPIVPHLTILQGIWGAAVALGALYERERSGRGQVVTVAGVHGAMIAAAGALTFDPASDLAARDGKAAGGSGGSVPFYRTYRCGDGEWLFLAALTPVFTNAAFGVLGVNDLLEDPRLEGSGRAGLLRPENIPWVIERLQSVFATRPRDEWLADLLAAGVPTGAVLERDAWLDHTQLAAIGMRAEVDDPGLGRVVMPGIALNLTATPGSIRAPSQFVRTQLAAAVRPTDGERRQVGSELAGLGPLGGVRVLDLGAIIAGPFAASLLADLGADVVKVEPLTGDSFRGPGFAAYNKGQRGVALDLRHPEGRDAFLQLVRTADVVIDNYRPGVLERLRITYDDLRAVKPDVICLSITGFGEGGAMGAGVAGFDPVLQAMSGMMRAQGGDSDPVFYTVPVNDVAASATVAFGACAALFHRARSGEGQRGWTSLAAMSALLQSGALVRYEGRTPPAVGGRDYRGTPADGYRQTDSGWIRVRETDGGVASVPARRPPDLARDEELLAYGVLRPDPRPDREGWVTPGRHAHLSRTELEGTLVSPALGEHTREVLRGAGLDDAGIDRLVADGVALEAATPP